MTVELRQIFGEKLSETCHRECEKLMSMYNLDPESLKFKWETYAINAHIQDNYPKDDTVDGFKNMLIKELVNAGSGSSSAIKKRAASNTFATPGRTPLSKGASDGLLNGLYSTPVSSSKMRRLQQTPSKMSPSGTAISSAAMSSPLGGTTPFSKRKTSGQIDFTLNSDLPKGGASSAARLDIEAGVNLKNFQYRTMYMKKSEIALYIDSQIEAAIEWTAKAFDIDATLFSNPAKLNSSEFFTVARIMLDNESSSTARLSVNNLAVQSCRRLGSQVPARLRIKQGLEYSLFQGQIVAMKGTNPSGKEFIVSEFLELPLLPPPATMRSELEEIALDKVQEQIASIMVAAGPYTADNNLNYDALSSLVNKINESRPQSVILFGPFIDINHRMIKSGDYGDLLEDENATIDDFFTTVVARKLAQVDSKIPVILIPSTQDPIIKHSAFPQPPFNRKALRLPSNFKCLSNPCSFFLNEVVVGVSSADVVKDISASLISSAGDGDVYSDPGSQKEIPDDLTAPYHHVIRQRHYYPCYPSQYSDAEGPDFRGTQVDVPYLGLAEMSEIVPDILILPSKTKPTAKVIDNVVVVNPGKMMIGAHGGTYAHISLSPFKLEGEAEDDVPCVHDVATRARVDITRI